MPTQQISLAQKSEYNRIATHPLQSYEWGEFRERTGVKVIRRGFFDPSTSSGQGKLVDGFQLTIHKIPHTPWNIGYLPKGNLPTKEVLEELRHIGKEERCIFIQLEPNVRKNVILSGLPAGEAGVKDLDSSVSPQNDNKTLENLGLRPAAHPLFTKFTFILDLTKSEEELLKNMHPKTRYNIKVAQKHGVTVQENNSDKVFEEYLRLTKQTTNRQGFYAHSEQYHRLMWQTLGALSAKRSALSENGLKAHLLLATYQDKILVAWIVFVFHDTLYYPYGASSSENRETMASTLMMWEAIKFGKKLGLKKFDMWGALGEEPDPKDPWYGFHRFKAGFGPEHVEFVGSYDLVISPMLYQFYKIADKVRWFLLRFKQ